MTTFYRFALPITTFRLLSYWATDITTINLPIVIAKSDLSEPSAKLSHDNPKSSTESVSTFRTKYWSNLPDKL